MRSLGATCFCDLYNCMLYIGAHTPRDLTSYVTHLEMVSYCFQKCRLIMPDGFFIGDFLFDC